MAGLLIPGLQPAFDATARSTALNGAADVAIAVERYRREDGRPPEKLRQLVPKFLPQVPIDPFDGQPLRYVVREDEYIIYSIGRDGKDDGGHGDDSGLEADIVFPVKIPQEESRSNP